MGRRSVVWGGRAATLFPLGVLSKGLRCAAAYGSSGISCELACTDWPFSILLLILLLLFLPVVAVCGHHGVHLWRLPPWPSAAVQYCW